MGTTTIEWTQNEDGTPGETWNPIKGCTRISPGCGGGMTGPNGERGGCYAEGIAARFSKPGLAFHGFAEMRDGKPRWTGKVALIPELLDEPLRRRKPTTWFISMSDLFHEKLTNEEIAAVFGVMAASQRHRFQVLTKRAERMRDWFAWVNQTHSAAAWIAQAAGDILSTNFPGMSRWDQALASVVEDGSWPRRNIWLGVSVEVAEYKLRLALLRDCPAAIRFASLEPALGDLGLLDLSGIDQVITGAESGHGARPMQEQWVRSIRDQAKAQGVAFFYKQRLNERKHKVSLPLLDGQQWAEMPEVATR